MQNFRKNMLSVMLMAVLQFGGMTLSAEPCFDCCLNNFSLGLESGYRQDRESLYIEDLDRADFVDTGYTSYWRGAKKIRIYQLGGFIEWEDPCSHLYAKLRGRYGWILDGDLIGYPLHWKLDGYTDDFELKIGYVLDVCCCFKFVPVAGYGYGTINFRLKNQESCANTPGPNAFSHHNGDKVKTTFSAPFIGFDVRFEDCFCGGNKVDFTFGYKFRYGNAHVHYKVPHFILTDDANTSRYGYKIDYRDYILHTFLLGGKYNLCNCWDLGMDVEYTMGYNTHSARVHLQHNKELVAVGQFSPTQFHVSQNAYYYSFVVNVKLDYNF